MRNTFVHFEIPAENPERAIAFFQKVFDWKFDRVSIPGMEYWTIQTVPVDEQGRVREQGMNGGLMRRMHPQQPFTNHVQVESVDAALKTIVDAGGEIALPKMPVPGVGWIAYFKDTEGNLYGLHQPDPTAA